MCVSDRPTIVLPPEIIDLVLRIDALDMEDLSNCCLVNKVWIEPARKYLYNVLLVGITFDQDLVAHSLDEEGNTTAELPRHLPASSSRLFRTLMGNPSLGNLVRHIDFEEVAEDEAEADESVPDSPIVWMRPAEAMAIFARLCPRTTGLGIFEPSWFSGSCKGTIRSKFRDIDRIYLRRITSQVWNDLQRFPNLKGITCREIELTPSPVPAKPVPCPALPITVLHVSACNEISWTAIQSATWQFLRELKVPVTVIPTFRPSQLPHLRRLALTARYDARDIPSSDFLLDLRISKSLAIFEINTAGYQSLDECRGYLGVYLPSTCHRVNLPGPPSLDTILPLVTNSESEPTISELGLPSSHHQRDDYASRTFLVAVRAILDSVGVELIWFN